MQIILIDFGASREFSKEFVDDYIQVIHGAAVNNRDKVLEYSTRLGFLTGYESKVTMRSCMLNLFSGLRLYDIYCEI